MGQKPLPGDLEWRHTYVELLQVGQLLVIEFVTLHDDRNAYKVNVGWVKAKRYPPPGRPEGRLLRAKGDALRASGWRVTA